MSVKSFLLSSLLTTVVPSLEASLEDVATAGGGLTQPKPCVLNVEVKVRRNERGLLIYSGGGGITRVLDIGK